MLKRLLCLTLALCLSASCALAFESYEIDPEAIKAVEGSDTFAVRITEKKLQEGYFEDEPCDVLLLTVTNFGEDVVTGVDVVFVLYKQSDQQTMELRTKEFSLSFGEDRKLNYASLSELSLQKDETAVIAIACYWDGFDGMRAIVSGCTLANGQTVSNPSYSEWESLAYGLQSNSNVTVLD